MEGAGGGVFVVCKGVRRLKFWGWGYEDQQPPPERVEPAAAGIRAHLGFGAEEVERPVRLEDLELPPPRLEPAACAPRDIFSSEVYERAAHLRQGLPRPGARLPRPVRPPARPGRPPARRGRGRAPCSTGARTPGWRRSRTAAAPAWSAASSRAGDGYAGAVTLDLGALDRVLEVDTASRAARIQAGALGPRSRTSCARTASRCATSRSRSSSRRWAAGSPPAPAATSPPSTPTSTTSSSRSAPSRRGLWESRRLPGSGPGPSPDRLLIGSEGILGVITEAWMRVQDRPRFRRRRASASTTSPGAGGARAVAVRACTRPTAACSTGRGRSDGAPARRQGAAGPRLRVGRPPARRLDGRARSSCARDHGGRCRPTTTRGDERGRRGRGRRPGGRPSSRRPTCATRSSPGSSARPSRPRSPGTASTSFHAAVTASERRARCRGVRRRDAHLPLHPRLSRRRRRPTSRVLAPGRRGSELEQWGEVKAGGLGGRARRRRHDHPPPRRRARPSALVRPPAAGPPPPPRPRPPGGRPPGPGPTPARRRSRAKRPAHGRRRPPPAPPGAPPRPPPAPARGPPGAPPGARAPTPGGGKGGGARGPAGKMAPSGERGEGRGGGGERGRSRGERGVAGLWRLRLPLPWPGVPHVNAWAIAAGSGVVLVDTGSTSPAPCASSSTRSTRPA